MFYVFLSHWVDALNIKLYTLNEKLKFWSFLLSARWFMFHSSVGCLKDVSYCTLFFSRGLMKMEIKQSDVFEYKRNYKSALGLSQFALWCSVKEIFYNQLSFETK